MTYANRQKDSVAALYCDECGRHLYMNADEYEGLENSGEITSWHIAHGLHMGTIYVHHIPEDAPSPITADDLHRVLINWRKKDGKPGFVDCKNCDDEEFHTWAKLRCDDIGVEINDNVVHWSLEERIEFCDLLWIKGLLALKPTENNHGSK